MSDRKLEKLRDKAYRDAYVRARVKIGIPYQIRALREQRGWSQGELGKRSQKPRNVISRLENPESGGNTIRTCLEMASAFDVALLVKFVSYSRFLKEFENVSPQAMEVPSFTSDPELLHPSSREFPSNISNYQYALATYQDALATQAGSRPTGEEALPTFQVEIVPIVQASNVSTYYYLGKTEIQDTNISYANICQGLVTPNYSETEFIGGKFYGQEENYSGRSGAGIAVGT